MRLFFVIARKEAINTRAVVVSNKGTTKKVTNILLASKGNASLVADILYATRIKLKHRGVRKINESNTRELGFYVKSLLRYVIPFVRILNLILGKDLLNTLRLV